MAVNEVVIAETNKLILSAGSAQRVIDEINALHGGRKVFKSPAMLYQYRSGTREPSPYFLWFLWKRSESGGALHDWAHNILSEMNEQGNGLPLE
jgi:hypothetical protein